MADGADPDPKGWNLIGMVDHRGGIGNAARSNIAAMREITQRHRVISFPSATYTTAAQLPAIHGRTYLHFNPCSRRIEDLAELEWFRKGANIGFWAWETTEPPPLWRTYEQHMRQIWVPSHFVKASLCNGGFDASRIHVIPHAIDHQEPHEYPAAGQPIRFLVQYDGHSRFARKRPDLSLQAITSAAMRARENVIITVKSHHTANCDVLALADYPGVTVELIDQWLSPAEMSAVWAQTDVFVSLNRGEGFGLPMVEAMARGTAVVATHWGGSEDYMREDNSFPVAYEKLEPTLNSGDAYFKTGLWAMPSVDDAAHQIIACMKEIRQGTIGMTAASARRTAQKFSFANMTAAMKSALSHL